DLSVNLDEVDILRITRGRFEVQLVKRGAATKGEGIAQHGMREDIDKRLADHKVLFDLSIINPWCLGAPFGDVVARDHDSGSTVAFTITFQSAFRSALFEAAPGTSAVYT